MQINRNIFRDYDIRGIAGVKFEPKIVAEYEKWYGKFPGITINLESVYAIGRAYGTRIKRAGGQKIVVGYELRPYADELKKAFVEGIIETGINVDDAGKTTTPLVYFLDAAFEYDGAVNITGSHNVYFYNGFKLMKKGSKKGIEPLFGEELQELYKMVLNDDYDIAEQKGKTQQLNNPYEIYKKYILDNVKLSRRVKIIVDCGNGTTGLYAMDFFQSLGCEVTGLYLVPDAYFPNHVPDPESPYNLKDLIAKVKEEKADFGIGFDADGDRSGFVDENGNFIYSDDLLLLFAKDVLLRNKNKKILFDVKCTELLQEMIPRMGGIPLMHKTGHAPIKDTMQKNQDIILGGEVSGHFFFGENYFRIDDGFYAAAQVLRIFSEQNQPFSTLFSFIPRRPRTPEIKLPCEDGIKHEVVQKIVQLFSKKYEVVTIDGARVMFDDTTWGLTRASNTSPYLTVRFEALTEKRLIEVKNIFADVLETFPQIKDKLDRKNIYSHTGTLGYV